MLYPLKSLIFIGRSTPTDADFSVVEADSFEEAWEKVQENLRSCNVEIDNVSISDKEIRFEIIQPKSDISTGCIGILMNSELKILR